MDGQLGSLKKCLGDKPLGVPVGQFLLVMGERVKTVPLHFLKEA